MLSLPSGDNRVFVIQEPPARPKLVTDSGKNNSGHNKTRINPELMFKKIMNNTYNGSLIITYSVSSNINNTQSSGKVTEYFSYKGYRSDYYIKNPEGVVNGRTIITDSFIECVKDNKWLCFNLSNNTKKSPIDNNIESPINKKPRISFSGRKRILGFSAYCFNFDYGLFTQDACYTDDAIMLRSHVEGPDGTSDMKVLSVEKKVSEGFLEPPAKPLDPPK